MSVSPDDLKKPETRPIEWQDQSKKSEKEDEKPDLYQEQKIHKRGQKTFEMEN